MMMIDEFDGDNDDEVDKSRFQQYSSKSSQWKMKPQKKQFVFSILSKTHKLHEKVVESMSQQQDWMLLL